MENYEITSFDIDKIVENLLPIDLEFPENIFDEPKPRTTTPVPADISSLTIEEQPTCCICMDSLGGGRNTTLKCGHSYHTDCILENISSAPSNKNKCPLCRADMCSKISVKEVDELKDELEALENTMEDKDEWSEKLRFAALYFHDTLEYKVGELLEAERELTLSKNYIKSMRAGLARTHAKLSKEIIDNQRTHAYKKCGMCQRYGHNISTCVTDWNPLWELTADPHYRIHHPSDLRSDCEIMDDIDEGGYWYPIIQNHFED